jgi:three-Cys-motif partner protein
LSYGLLPKIKYRVSDYSRWVTSLPLEFVGDAISLSGLTGTRLKCEVIRTYYPFWWKITSGGKRWGYQWNTAIVELNAATGEVYIKDTGETLLGSAGHALDLKINHFGDEELYTENLKTVLVEEDDECYRRLKRVIRRRWAEVPLDMVEGPFWENSSNIYLLNDTLEDALSKIENLDLGNAIFYFDPLLSVTWDAIEKVAKSRMEKPFETRTEFIIFLFTSDWFLGREGFEALPSSLDEEKWTEGQRKNVLEADALFGDQEWRKEVLCEKPIEAKEKNFLQLYKNKLWRWFRYVLLMPFNPKENQLFHLILCSNYEAGVNATKNAFASKTLNPIYRPDNNRAYKNFIFHHPETARHLTGRRKPLVWKILWKIIKSHQDGICDSYCKDFRDRDTPITLISRVLEWLRSEGYLENFDVEDSWGSSLPRYRLNWEFLGQKLKIRPPSELTPISAEEFDNTPMGRLLEVKKKWKQASAKRQK